MSKTVGYARVSSKEQNLSRQISALSQYVDTDMIVCDKASGKDFNRDGYQSLKVGIGKLVKGDTLYIKSLDRLSRNKEQAKAELQYFRDNGIRVKILDIPTTMIDYPTNQEWVLDMITNILIEVLTSIAENERETIKQRQREGYNAMPVNKRGKRVSAKTGNDVGRPKAIDFDTFRKEYKRVVDGEVKPFELMNELNMKKSTFYRYRDMYLLESKGA